MWILNFLPTWTFSLLFFIGIVAYIITKTVPLIPQKQLIQWASIALVFVATYFSGAVSNEQAWLDRVKELEQRVAIAEEKSNSANKLLQTKVETKIKTIKETVYVNTDTIRETAGPQIDANCTLPVSSIVLHNSASRAEVARGPSSTDGTPSGVAPSAFLTTVVENYGNCHENAERLKAWQEWYRQQKQIFEGLK